MLTPLFTLKAADAMHVCRRQHSNHNGDANLNDDTGTKLVPGQSTWRLVPLINFHTI